MLNVELDDVDRILIKNSRITAINSLYIPISVGALVLSGVYLTSSLGIFDFCMGVAYLGMAIFAFTKREKQMKTVEYGL